MSTDANGSEATDADLERFAAGGRPGIFQKESEYVPPGDPIDRTPKRGPDLTKEGKTEVVEERPPESGKGDFGDLFGEDAPPEENPKPDTTPTPSEEKPTGEANPIPETPQRRRSRKAQYESLAEIALRYQYALMSGLFDPVEANPLIKMQVPDGNGGVKLVDVHPDGQSMHDGLKAAWVEYFESKGISEVSPGWALAIVQGSYVIAVLSQPKSRTKMVSYLEKGRELFGKLFAYFRRS